MKRIITLALSVVICVILCSCEKDNSILLTMDNYTDYLEVTDDISEYHHSAEVILYDREHGSEYSLGPHYQGAEVFLCARGVSEDYVYNDIVITGHFVVTYYEVPKLIFELEETTRFMKTAEFDIETTTDEEGIGAFHKIIKASDYVYINIDSCKIDFEVTGVSGSVTPVR